MPFNKLDHPTKEFLERLCGQQAGKNNDKKHQHHGEDKKNNPFNLTPSQILVVAGILGGALEVDSILVDRAQQVQIVLVGSFKQKDEKDDGEIDKILEQIGSKSFDEVLKAMINRLT